MYEALGVRDIDKLLRAPSTDEPIPKDPAQENIDLLENTQLKAFEGQDHDAHLIAHLTFGTSGTVAAMPNLTISLQKHVLEHIQLKAQEQAMSSFMQQNQGKVPSDQEALAIDALAAQLIAQELGNAKQISTQLANIGQQEGPDPLVQLKEQELQIKAQGSQADIARDQAELQLDREKEIRKGREFQERLQSQENQTSARINSAMEREILKLRDRGQ